MVKIRICDHIVESIEKHARNFRGMEIYGWLIGLEKSDELTIIASIPCKTYHSQNEIRAEPSHEEIVELSKSLPVNIGIVGIYHSHTKTVFHSVTDNLTVKQFASVYPHFVSIVTNGAETKFYQLEEKEVREITINKIKEVNLVAINFTTELEYHYSSKNISPITVSSELREILEESKIRKLIYQGKEIRNKNRIDEFKDKAIKILLEYKKQNKLYRVELGFVFTILCQPTLRIEEINKFFPQGLRDSMYYLLKNTTIEKGKFHLPQIILLNIANIPWRVIIPENDVQKIIHVLDSLVFRMEFMSFKDEKRRLELLNKIKEIKQLLQKDQIAKEKLDRLLIELSKEI